MAIAIASTMNRLKQIRVTELKVRWVGIFVLAFFIALTSNDPTMIGEPFWKQYLVSFGFTALYWTGAFYIFLFFRNIFTDINQTAKRLFSTYFVLFIWMSIGGIPLKIIIRDVEMNLESILFSCGEYFFLNIVLAIIVGTMYETVYFFEKWKETIKQNEELKNQQIRTQFEVLQNQMSPHFLFNSLNTLTTLIAENQEIAIDFTQNLSEVYRYILQNKERELVSLKEEIEFAESYVYLLKKRFPDNFTCDFRVDKSLETMSIAPMTLQMLIENAIKHNVVSKAHPLHVEVYVDNGKSIIVKNNLQVRQTIEKSTKTGLANIKKRYEYFTERKVDIIVTPQSYMVAVPLIELVNEVKNK
jgi:two-component system, LytTR family, sensor kinase